MCNCFKALWGAHVQEGLHAASRLGIDESQLTPIKTAHQWRRVWLGTSATLAMACVAAKRIVPYDFVIYYGIEIKRMIPITYFGIPLALIPLTIGCCQGKKAYRLLDKLLVDKGNALLAEAKSAGANGSELWTLYKDFADWFHSLELKQGFTDAELAKIAQRNPKLKQATFDATLITGKGIGALLTDCKELQLLHLEGKTTLTDEQFKVFDKGTALKELKIAKADNFNDQALQALCNLSLQVLRLEDVGRWPIGRLGKLQVMTTLQELELDFAKWEDFTYFSGLVMKLTKLTTIRVFVPKSTTPPKIETGTRYQVTQHSSWSEHIWKLASSEKQSRGEAIFQVYTYKRISMRQRSSSRTYQGLAPMHMGSGSSTKKPSIPSRACSRGGSPLSSPARVVTLPPASERSSSSSTSRSTTSGSSRGSSGWSFGVRKVR